MSPLRVTTRTQYLREFTDPKQETPWFSCLANPGCHVTRIPTWLSTSPIFTPTARLEVSPKMAKVMTNNNSSSCFSSSFLQVVKLNATQIQHQLKKKQKTHIWVECHLVLVFFLFIFIRTLLSFPRFCFCSHFVCWIAAAVHPTPTHTQPTSTMSTQHQPTKETSITNINPSTPQHCSWLTSLIPISNVVQVCPWKTWNKNGRKRNRKTKTRGTLGFSDTVNVCTSLQQFVQYVG